MSNGGGELPSEERCSVEEVALVVPETDDPTLPVMTFRSWVLGLVSCCLLIFLNTFFTYRSQPLAISAILMQIAVLPIGRFMASTLPNRDFHFFRWKFSLNPGPFNMKEHVIITIFANCGISYGGGDAYSIGAITVMKAYYKQGLNFFLALLIVLTTQILGYGWAGMLRRYLVDPVEMWWPANLAQVSLFRALHETEDRSKGMTRMKFLLIFMGASFVYYVFPGYLLQILSFFSWVCWVWPRSITAQQIGSSQSGLGLGAFSFDWAGISAYHGSPLVSPWSSILNVGVGFVMFIYIVLPVCYWKFNTFDARKFPIFSNKLFTRTGQKYDTTKVLTPEFELNVAAYNNYGKLYLSPLFALSIGSGFARFTATLTHVALFHGRDIWKQSRTAIKNAKLDIHAKLMQSYKQVPEWWFLILLFGSTVISLLMSIVWKDIVQLPWWGMLFAFAMAWIVTLPIGVIQATTNQQPGYDIIAQLIIGYILPGKPIANLLFKIYGRISTVHALSFLSDLKLGHYMKIPPRCMYTAQLVGTLVAGTINLAVAWWMLDNIENICDTEALQPDSPWTCPKYRVTFDASVIWGLIGPRRLFGPGGLYRNLVWLFLIGAVLPVPIWALSKAFPEKKWIALINIPVISYGFAGMPPATPTNIASWLITGTIFNYFVFRYHKRWWQKYNYVLSAALDAGTAFMGVLLFIVLQNGGHSLRWWGSQPDHCPLAKCPTAPGIVVKGCPVF
ncbi:oligopeptide transporter 3-like isoform X3 [Cucurbita pepo subsp. pepo]|uniref:oligopeptide transporter 3-like isoform X1 n=1 Tax=Cucurbita pepo subsp. pepo TaxID=3664 RepID=UPI000C9D852A|nr:oligopeptide transporter 3-like isoform X1 [Cucurbita pepo subsp. pepo]XP_023520809.1 oligopeptide transporter 3-like isoform X2 [Cucurbita pepo subsp. pepo]XP_023520810.1 oligopeptide transporter 3-like isoform X3 [Cucurbita pepo subsp. pepo]